MKRLLSTLLVALVAAGCARNTARPPLRLSGPSGVALYRGYARSSPGALKPLLAVANTRGDDLRIIDAVTDVAEQSPTMVQALAVPTDPRPSLIASGRLGDVDAAQKPLPMPDLLVVAPTGLVPSPNHVGQFSAVLQLIVTWEATTTVAETVDLGDVAPGAALTCLTVLPGMGPDPSTGALVPTPGSAMVVAGLTDSSLVMIQALRVPNTPTGTIALQPSIVSQPLGFMPLDLAASEDLAHLYAATTEPIPAAGGTLGVAEFDLSGLPGALPIRAISARAGTTRVAAITIANFQDNNRTAPIPDFDNFLPAVPRVLAALDDQACGRDRSMPCGVAVLDPVIGDLAPDPAGELPFQMPIQVGGEVVSIAVSHAPSVSTVPGYVELAPGSGRRWTQAIAAISASSGQVYMVDLSHFALGNDVSSLTGPAATRVISGITLGTSENLIGVWPRVKPTPPAVITPLGDSRVTQGIGVTPGFTTTDSWTVTFQGILPGLDTRFGIAEVPAGAPAAPTQIALQDATELTGAGTSAWRGVVRVYDPRLAVRIGDIVEVGNFPNGVCPLGMFDLVVTGILPPTADTPGGALAVAEAPLQPVHAGQAAPGDPKCLPAGSNPRLTFTVRASGFVVVGATTGYVGRTTEVAEGDVDAAVPFRLRYENEDLLSCPIMPDSPQDWPPAPAAIATCEADVATCRATCERLVLARRARRIFYVTSRCGKTTEVACYNAWQAAPNNLTFPLPNGPALEFKVGVLHLNGATGAPARGNYLLFTTGSGLVPAAWVPYVGTNATAAILPGKVVLFDRTEATGLATDALHGFAAFAGNVVLDFATTLSAQNATTIR